MSKQDVEPDPNPLAAELFEKTKTGKLRWEPTADKRSFIVSIGGETTLKLYQVSGEEADPWGQPQTVTVPKLALLDAKGNTLWEIATYTVKGGLWPLYTMAQRIANKVDERMATIMDSLKKL